MHTSGERSRGRGIRGIENEAVVVTDSRACRLAPQPRYGTRVNPRAPWAQCSAAMSSVESVKVAVRVRPFNGREKDAKSSCIIRVCETLACLALPARVRATTPLALRR